MALGALTSQMNESLEYIVTKRQNQFDYLKRAHQGKTHWLNLVQLSKNAILKYLGPEKMARRCRRWFMFGLSVGRLLEYGNGADIVRGLVQLFEEYDHWISHQREREKLNNRAVVSLLPHMGTGVGGYVQISGSGSTATSSLISSSLTVTSTSSLLYCPLQPPSVVLPSGGGAFVSLANNSSLGGITSSSSSSGGSIAEIEPIKPSLQKINRQINYTALLTPASAVPYSSFDYCEVVYSLCDVFSLVYSKFLDESCQISTIHEAALKVDKKIKVIILSKISDDLTSVAKPLLKLELKGLFNHLFIDESKSNPITKKYYTLSEEKEGLKEKKKTLSQLQGTEHNASLAHLKSAEDSDDEDDED